MKQKCRKQLVIGVLVTALLISGTAGMDTQAAAKAAVKLNKSQAALIEGRTITLKVKTSKGKKVTSVKWSSKNKKVATVSKRGKVTAKKKGTAKIKCVVKYRERGTSKTSKKTLTCKVKVVSKNNKTRVLGGMSPKAALKYMKETKNLVIVDVATAGRYKKEHFNGAINIPIEELSDSEADALYMKIPKGRPVLIHCRLGMIAPDAYARVRKLRPDIPEISYIDGIPPFAEYNEWLAEQKK